VVEPEEPALLAQAILGLVSDQTMRHAMGWAGRAFVEKEYSWSTIVGRWLEELGISHELMQGK
jgi:colanic acid biosynthesis glycosyl transferase WcaI